MGNSMVSGFERNLNHIIIMLRAHAILRSTKNSWVNVISTFYEKPCYYLLIIYIKVFKAIVVLTYISKRKFAS